VTRAEMRPQIKPTPAPMAAPMPRPIKVKHILSSSSAHCFRL
jgi:hypothetical protein